MNAAVIAPVGLLERYCTTEYHLALAHLMGDEKYLEFYHKAARKGEFVILDNSVIELGKPVEAVDLMAAVEAFQPNEVVLCDFPQNPAATESWARQFGPAFKERWPDLKLMAVPQWQYKGVIESWLANYVELIRYDFVDTVGIPKFLGEYRPQVCAIIDEMGTAADKEYHLLGTWGNPVEVKALARYDWIRGVDSKIPVRAGQYGVALHPQQGLLGARHDLPALDFYYDADPMPIITSHNCKVYRSWAEFGKEAEVRPFRGRASDR